MKEDVFVKYNPPPFGSNNVQKHLFQCKGQYQSVSLNLMSIEGLFSVNAKYEVYLYGSKVMGI